MNVHVSGFLPKKRCICKIRFSDPLTMGYEANITTWLMYQFVLWGSTSCTLWRRWCTVSVMNNVQRRGGGGEKKTCTVKLVPIGTAHLSRIKQNSGLSSEGAVEEPSFTTVKIVTRFILTSTDTRTSLKSVDKISPCACRNQHHYGILNCLDPQIYKHCSFLSCQG